MSTRHDVATEARMSIEQCEHALMRIAWHKVQQASIHGRILFHQFDIVQELIHVPLLVFLHLNTDKWYTPDTQLCISFDHAIHPHQRSQNDQMLSAQSLPRRCE